MIIDKTIKFGYGDIAVGSDALRSILYFYGIKPPLNIGENVNDDIEVCSNKIEFEIDYDDYIYIYQNITAVKNGSIKKFHFRDYILDFTNYNIESVNVVEKHINVAMFMYRMALAA